VPGSAGAVRKVPPRTLRSWSSIVRND
jgi:hypothetical protein